MAFGQCGLDGGLALQQPVECGVEFGVADVAEAERFAEAGGRRGGRQRPGGGELGDGIEDAAGQHGQDEVAAAVAFRAEDAVEADLARGAEGGGDVAVGEAAGDGEGVVLGRDDGAALEHAAQALDVGRGPVGEVAEGAFADLAVLAIALAQEDGGGRVAVRDDVDIHGWNGVDSARKVQSHSCELHGYVFGWSGGIFQEFRRIIVRARGKLGLKIKSDVTAPRTFFRSAGARAGNPRSRAEPEMSSYHFRDSDNGDCEYQIGQVPLKRRMERNMDDWPPMNDLFFQYIPPIHVH